MTNRKWLAWCLFVLPIFVAAPLLATQPGEDKKEPGKKEFGKDFPFGGGFGKGGPGGFGGPMNQRRELVKQFDKDGDGRLNAEERQAAREFIKKQGGGKGFGPGGFGKGGPGGFGKGTFGPGTFMARPLIDALDTDKDGKLSQAELIAGVKRFFADNDKEKTGSLDEAQILDGLNRILPAPPGFPGGGFKDFPKDAPKEQGKDGPKEGPKDGFGFKGGPKGFFFAPGKALAGEIVKRADTKKNGKVTLEQLITAAESAFKEADKEKTGKLDETAVGTAISQLFPAPMGGFGPGGFGKGGREPGKPGPKVTPVDVKSYPNADLYDTTVLRTIFIDFDNRTDWEAELADFYHTDVEVPATVIVDGKRYKDVGIHFRGNSSYFMTGPGNKRSLNLSFNFVDEKQRLYGYRATNLLNCAEDPTFMHSVLYCNLSRKYIPAPKANFVKVVINGESWGIYANQQQFNKDYLRENFKTTKGARWRVPGHPGASAGLGYIGDDIAAYKRHYQIKTDDKEEDWKALIELCRVLNKTPTDELEAAIRPILDVDAVLWFVALDNASINDDGYWTRASDYSLYRDPKGKFHIGPYDTNETFTTMGGGFGFKGGPGGPFGKGPKDGGEFGKGGFGKGPKGGGYNLDPLVGVDNPRTPLYRLLTVPKLRKQYLDNMRTLASESLEWKKLKPVIDQYRTLIEKEIEIDTRKHSSLAEFKASLSEDGGGRFNLKAFADGRSSYLLGHPEIKKLSESR